MLLVAGLMALQGTPVGAAPGSRAFDLQCMIVTQQAAGEIKDSKLALMVQLAAVFYMGRVDLQMSDAQLADEAQRASKVIEGKPLGPILTACGEFMQGRGERFERIGSELARREAAPQIR